MMPQDLMVIVIAQSRSGSSLLTKIFHLHGLDTGKCRVVTQPMYPVYESLSVHGFIQANISSVASSRRKDNDLSIADDLRAAFSKSVNGPAVLKAMIQHDDLMRAAFPDATFVYGLRDAEAVGKSLWKRGRTHLEPDAMIPHAKYRNQWILDNAEKYACPVVHVSRLMEGDLSSLQSAMDYCGIEMDEAKVNNAIDRKLWTSQ